MNGVHLSVMADDIEVFHFPIAENPTIQPIHSDRNPSTTPGAEPPRDVRDSSSARSHSMHLETSSSDRP